MRLHAAVSVARPHLHEHKTARTLPPVLVCTLHHLLQSQAQLLSLLQLVLLLASLQGCTGKTGGAVSRQILLSAAVCVDGVPAAC